MTIRELVNALQNVPEEDWDDINVRTGSHYAGSVEVSNVYMVKALGDKCVWDTILLSTF